MFSVSSAITTPASLAISSVVAAAPSTDRVSTRQTAQGVAAPLTNASVANDSRPSTPVSSSSVTALATTESQTVSGATGNSGNTGSSAFLAQLFSQEDDSDLKVETTFAHFAPAPTYNEFVAYSVVKFRPSDAGLPSPYASVKKAPAENPAPAVAPNEYRAYSTTQSRNSSELADTHLTLHVAG